MEGESASEPIAALVSAEQGTGTEENKKKVIKFQKIQLPPPPTPSEGGSGGQEPTPSPDVAPTAKRIIKIPKFPPLQETLIVEPGSTPEAPETEPQSPNDPDRITPFGSTTARPPKPTPRPEATVAAQTYAQPPQMDHREAYRQRLRAMAAARSKRGGHGAGGSKRGSDDVDNKPFTKKQRKQFANTMRTKGIEAALSQIGIADPGIQKIMSEAASNGDINNVSKIAEAVTKYMASQRGQ